MTTLVVPTNRPDRLAEFLDAWQPLPFAHVVVVEDGPAITIDHPDVEVFSWAEIAAIVPDPSIFSRGDSAIRCFGFWQAWRAGAETVITLDDDCYPIGDPADFVARHREVLDASPRWETTVPGLRVRGLPYRNVGHLPAVDVNMGVWTGTPDLDAITQLSEPARTVDEAVAGRSRIMPSERYWPMSGMNLAISRRALPLMYFPPMGEGQPYRRFDDIWCGLVVQRVARHLRLNLAVGAPAVDHQRASDPFVNLVKEAPGVRANELVWEVIDAIPLTADDPLGCMREIGEGLLGVAVEDPYLATWGRGVLGWAALFETRP